MDFSSVFIGYPPKLTVVWKGKHWEILLLSKPLPHSLLVAMCKYKQIYTQIHTHTHTHISSFAHLCKWAYISSYICSVFPFFHERWYIYIYCSVSCFLKLVCPGDLCQHNCFPLWGWTTVYSTSRLRLDLWIVPSLSLIHTQHCSR